MKRDFSTVLVGLSGKPAEQDGKQLCIGHVVAELLLADPKGQLSAADKLKRHNLAVRVFACGEVELTPEEVGLIDKASGEYATVLAYGQIHKLLNTETVA